MDNVDKAESTMPNALNMMEVRGMVVWCIKSGKKRILWWKRGCIWWMTSRRKKPEAIVFIHDCIPPCTPGYEEVLHGLSTAFSTIKGEKKRKKEVCRCFLRENLWWVVYIFHKFAA